MVSDTEDRCNTEIRLEQKHLIHLIWSPSRERTCSSTSRGRHAFCTKRTTASTPGSSGKLREATSRTWTAGEQRAVPQPAAFGQNHTSSEAKRTKDTPCPRRPPPQKKTPAKPKTKEKPNTKYLLSYLRQTKKNDSFVIFIFQWYI